MSISYAKEGKHKLVSELCGKSMKPDVLIEVMP